MKDLEKENCGDLAALEKLSEGKVNSYTVEQMLDSKLKNVGGESNEEVRKRMFDCMIEILKKHSGKRVVVVSHGAAIKYFLQNWCEYVYEEDALYFNGEFACPRKLESPSIVKLEFEEDTLKKVRVIE